MVTQGIRDTNRQFIDALARGDAAGVTAVYAEDGKLLPSNSPMLSGRQAIQEFWQGVIDSGIRGATVETVDLEELGDTAIEVGAYTLDIRPAGGEATQDVGKYVIIWKRQADGSWKWAVDIFNTNLPPPG